MNPGEALAGGFAGAVDGQSPLNLARELRTLFGGQNSALARELNVNPRTVQRWFTTAQQRRTPRGASADAIRTLAEHERGRLAAQQVRRRGVQANVRGDVIDPSGNARLRQLSTSIPSDSEGAEALAVALESGDADDIAAAFDGAFFGAYGGLEGFGFTDIERLDMGWG